MLWVILALIGIVGGIAYARYRFRQQEVLSLIVLYREPTVLLPERLKSAAAGLGMNLEVAENPFDFTLDGYSFRLMSAPMRYGEGMFDIDKVIEDIREMRLRDAMREHKSFASFWYVDTRREEWLTVLDLLGRLVAEVSDEAAIVVWRADTNQAVRLTDEVRERMRAGETNQVLGEEVGDEVIGFDSEDERMVKAIQEAQERWPEFVEAVARIKDQEKTFLKARFTDGEETEHMWITVKSAGEEGAKGILQNQPLGVRFLKQGQEVEVQKDDVSDWAYIEGEEATGFFTEKLVRGIEE